MYETRPNFLHICTKNGQMCKRANVQMCRRANVQTGKAKKSNSKMTSSGFEPRTSHWQAVTVTTELSEHKDHVFTFWYYILSNRFLLESIYIEFLYYIYDGVHGSTPARTL